MLRKHLKQLGYCPDTKLIVCEREMGKTKMNAQKFLLLPGFSNNEFRIKNKNFQDKSSFKIRFT